MLEQIDKILKSDWSANWFSQSSTISPLIKTDNIKNLDKLSLNLIQLITSQNSKSTSDNSDLLQYLQDNNSSNNNSTNDSSKILNTSTTLFFMYNTKSNQSKHDRIEKLRGLFSNIQDDDKLNRLDDLLNQKYNQSNLELNDNNMIDDLINKMSNFINLQEAINDLSILSLHFPTGLCTSQTAYDIIKQGDSMRNKRKPQSLISEAGNPESFGENDPSLKQKLMKNHGFYGLWMNMQKTFCGINTKTVLTNDNTNKNSTTTNQTADDNVNLLNISQGQLKSLSLLFHVIYSNPVILYSPNSTVVTEKLIAKSNTTFELIDKINIFFQQWLEQSDSLIDFLKTNQTNQSLTSINKFKSYDLKFKNTTSNSSRIFNEKFKLFKNLPNKTNQDLIDQIRMIDSAACSWLSLMSGVNLNIFKGFSNEEDLVDYFLNEAYFDNVTVIASVVFNLKNSSLNNSKLDSHITYKIRQNASFTYTTKKIRERYWYPSPRDWDYYYYLFGFVWLQDLIDRAIIDYHSNRTVLEPGTYLHQMPYPCYTIDNFLQMIQHVMPLCLSISFVYTVSILTQQIVYEKELRLKEVMKIMGMNNSVHLFAWFITYFLQFTLIMMIVTCILHFGKILTHSNPYLVFLILEVYSISTICFSFLVSSLYSKAKLAAACAGILYFLSYVPCMYISIREDVAYEIIAWWAKTFACLLSTSAFGIGSKYIAFYENDGAGIQWNNLDKSPLENDNYNCLNCIKIMLIDCLIYLILAWYIENVNPSYGIPLPLNYPFKKSYWLGQSGYVKLEENNRLNEYKNNFKIKDYLLRPFNYLFKLFKIKNKPAFFSVTEEEQARLLHDRVNRSLLHNSINDNENDNDDNLITSSPIKRSTRKSFTRKHNQFKKHTNLFEQEPQNLPIGVSIRNLTKKYSDSKLAVDNLSVNFYENQITAFLGHNGAGKTTTMSILSGLIPATSGHALIYNKDIRTDINLIRKNLGICPQHNILFDRLTVEEHLWFYAKLKHMNDKSIKDLINNMLRDTGLIKKRNNLVNQLSGGMQRKLSVAIAFVGDANLVILDEPTAGVDPYARRAIWDLLLKYKQNRTIILSTHHMDEAELLGDRIAIISNGRLTCSGTSLFLKNALGEGNNLTIVKDLAAIEKDICKLESDLKSSNENFDNDLKLNENSSEIVLRRNSQNLMNFILKYIPSAYLKEETLREYHFIIPLYERSNQSYWNLFKDLESNINDLRISSYGIHDVSLEEIFIKAAQIEDNKSSSSNKIIIQDDNEDDEILINIQDASSSAKNLEESSLSNSVNQEEEREDTLSENSLSSSSLNNSLYNLDYIYTDLVKGYKLYLKQFMAIFIKRFLYNKRNWKSLLTQIVLPACFICIAMTVALSAPGFLDLPQLELTTAQFYPLTKPEGIYVPFSYDLNTNETNLDDCSNSTRIIKDDLYSATSIDIIKTLNYLVGIGGTCVLNRENLTLKDIINFDFGANRPNQTLLNQNYFGNSDSCRKVFNPNADIDFEYFQIKNLTNKFNYLYSNFKSLKKYYPDCICLKDFSGFECNTNFEMPNSRKLVTHETLLNISGSNETDYYLYTTEIYRLKRYGGLSFDNERLIKKKKCESVSSSSSIQQQETTPFYVDNSIKNIKLIQNLIKNKRARVWYNNKGFHSMPTFLNVMNNAILRANVRKSFQDEKKSDVDLDVMANKYGITVINHPMNQTNNYLSTEYLLQGSDVLISIFTIVAMSFVNASFVLFLVYERSNKSLHLQFLIGLNPLLYWITNFLWDMLNYMLPAACVIIIFKVFNVPAYVEGSNYPAVILLFLFYGWSVSPLMYPLTFIFKEPSNAYIFLIVINLFTGITCVESSFLLQVFSIDKELKFIYDMLKIGFLVFPPYCLGRGLIDIAYNDYYNSFFAKTGQFDKIRSPFEWDITTRNLLAMACIGCISWVFTLLLEYDFFKFKWLNFTNNKNKMNKNKLKNYKNNIDVYRKKEDPDVFNERVRIENYFDNEHESINYNNFNDRLILRSLRKVYDKNISTMSKLFNRCKNLFKRDGKLNNKHEFVAVKDLTFGVPEGECFGLLGVNGAGKTTTFKMLTTDFEPTDGDILIQNEQNEYLDSLINKSKYWNYIGYCPQFDALYDELTPSDHIRLFARLKGVQTKYEEELCKSLLKRLDLMKYENKPVGSLSLGNKRKLSVALSLVGNPLIVLLDEPTSGMDPVSRRRLWEEIINLTREKNRSVLLTSHSMEECEVLCTRLAIMVDGRFKCMGSVQHLKTKFGEGYTLTVKIKDLPNHLSYTPTGSDLDDDLLLDSSRNNSIASNDNGLVKKSKNKYINLILKELKEKISVKCNLKERHFNNVFQFELPCPVISSVTDSRSNKNDYFNIGDVYRLIELNKLRFSIADYSLSQNTLDNVFINFIREQTTSKKNQKTSNNSNNSSSFQESDEDSPNKHNQIADSSSDNDDEDNDVNNSNKAANRKQTLNTSNSLKFPLHDHDDLLIDLNESSHDVLSKTKNNDDIIQSSSSSSNSPTTSSKKTNISINSNKAGDKKNSSKKNQRNYMINEDNVS